MFLLRKSVVSRQRCFGLAAVLLGLGAVLPWAQGQTVSNYAVMVTAAAPASPPEIILSWVPDAPDYGYTIERPGWGSPVSLPKEAVSHTDINVVPGERYTYTLYKDFNDFVGEGYVTAGIEASLMEDRGKLLLLAASNHAAALAIELARLECDLAGDGWTVLRRDLPPMMVEPSNTNPSVWQARSNEIASVKALIAAEYDADPSGLKAVFLLGHLPVPYSGNLNPDAHPEHKGAWPADVYYGDVDADWTDSSVSNSAASDPRNRNVPGDGKFDQNYLLSRVELQVGRVDFAGLPAFPLSEAALLRRTWIRTTLSARGECRRSAAG